MLTATQVRLLAPCPTCGAPQGRMCRARTRTTYDQLTGTNHRLRVRAAIARATELRIGPKPAPRPSDSAPGLPPGRTPPSHARGASRARS